VQKALVGIIFFVILGRASGDKKEPMFPEYKPNQKSHWQGFLADFHLQSDVHTSAYNPQHDAKLLHDPPPVGVQEELGQADRHFPEDWEKMRKYSE